VDAAVARLDVADEALLAVDREMGVALERGQKIARRPPSNVVSNVRV